MTMNSTFSLTTVGKEMVMKRDFNFPARLVFDAWTRPEHIPHWFGPRSWSVPVCRIDLRVGGRYHYEMKKDSGETMTIDGVFDEISPYTLLRTTETFDEAPDQPLKNTMILEEDGRVTHLTVTTLFETEEMAAAWAEGADGADESFDRLDELLATL